MHVLILGGGAIGLSLAYELARRGRRVRVVERGTTFGQESSWAGAGILPPPAGRRDGPPLEQLANLGARLHPEWADRLLAETGIDNGYRRCGAVYMAVDEASAGSLAHEAAAWREQQIDHRLLTETDLDVCEPALSHLFRSGVVRQAYHLSEESQLRNPRHVQALQVACRQQKVDLVTGAEVLDFRLTGGAVDEVRTTAGNFAAEQVVFCTGAWTGDLAGKLGLEVSVRPIRGQIVLLRTPQPILRGIVNVGRRYFVARPDGRLLVGSTEEDAGFDKSNTTEAVADLQQFAYQLVPELRDAVVERTWAGLRPYSSDGLPYLGRAPRLNNAFVAAGHYRWGLALSAATAVVMAQHMLGERPLVDLAAFRPDRPASFSLPPTPH